MQRMQDFERKWAMGVIERHISSFSVTAANAQALMQLSQMYGEAYTLQVILPIVKNHTSNMGFIVAFLTALFRAGETDIVRPEIVRILFGDILAAVIPDLDLHRQASRDFGPGNESLRVISPEDLANLFFQCEYLGLSHEIDKLANKIILEASHMESTIFERLLLPLVKQLAPVVERDPNNINTPRFVKTFRTMIPSYINAYVQFPPQKPTGLEHQPRDCNLHCRDCNTFDDFLKSPDEEVLYFFKLNAKRRTHLEERLRGSSCRTETIKKGRLYTFVVTKKGLEWKNAMKEWNQRCGFALEKVEEIGVERLRSLLREGWEVDCLPIFADSNLSNDDDLLGE